MNTKQMYYQNPYQTELDCTVVSTEQSGNLLNTILDQTIFYPEGGGQPSDRGTLGASHVEYVRVSDGEIVHQVKGDLKKGDAVKGVVDWNWRYKYMQIHTAGHLLHDVLMTIVKDLKPIRGSHGKKAFLEYEGELDISLKEQIEMEVNKIAQSGLDVVTKEATYEELERDCQFLPPNLPRNKPLRMIKIGNYPPVPDGGVHVKKTNELGKIWIANITIEDGKTNVRYGVVGKD